MSHGVVEEAGLRANGLMAEGRLIEAVTQLERGCELEPADYRDPARLAAWRKGLTRESGDTLPGKLALCLALIQGLSLIYRVRDGLRLFAALLDLEPARLEDPERVVQAVAESDLPQDPSFRVALASTAAGPLGMGGQARTGLRLLEGVIPLESEDYSTPQRCAARLATGLEGVDLEVRTSWLTLLTASLLREGRAEDSLALFSADLGLTENPATLPLEVMTRALRRRLAEISGHGLGTYGRGLARALAANGELAHAIAILENHAGLAAADYDDPKLLAARLSDFFLRTSDVTGLSFTNELIGNLKDDGQLEKAGALLQVYVDRFVLAKGRQAFGGSPLPDFTALFELWLEIFGDEPGRKPLEVCRRLVEQLVASVDRAPELEDRRAFLETLGNLRRRLLFVGHRRAAEERDPAERRMLFGEILSWDAELYQRLLRERYLFGEMQLAPPGDPPAPGRVVVDRLVTHLRSKAEAAGEPDGWLGETESGLASETLGLETVPMAERPIAPLDPGSLGRVLGQGTLLLRAAFGPDGQLVWGLWESRPEGLEILHHGSGNAGDLETLRWAVARHSLASKLIEKRSLSGPEGRRFSQERHQLVHALNLLGDVLRTESLHSTESSRRLLATFRDQFRPTHRALGDLMAGLRRHLEENSDTPLQWPRPDLTKRLLPFFWKPLFASQPEDEVVGGAPSRRAWAAKAAAQVETCLSLVHSILVSKESKKSLLDAATRRYLDEVSEIWPLDLLQLPPERDCVFLVEDLLHSVPLACLQVGGKPLYRQVRSIRTSLGLLMDVAQRRQEESASPSPGRLLTLSHDRPDEKALRGMATLHRGLVEIGEELGLQTWAAASQPPATVGTLRAALETHNGFDVVTICGHGEAERAGVVLQDPGGDSRGILWQGAGCDLSSVGWLFMVSCSMGRVEQSGERDAEGFAIELALHGARSVAAFRWPIESGEAAAFTIEALGEYLRNLSSGQRGLLRARALNAARRRFLEEGMEGPAGGRVSLHTIAACELYGLG